MIKQEISKEIWEQKYKFKDETEEQFYKRIVNGLFKDCTQEMINIYADIIDIDENKFLSFVENILKSHNGMLAGRPTYAIGTDRENQTFSNCYVLPIKKDSMSAIMDCIKEAAMTMKAGGGNGYSFSILRPKNSSISTSGGYSTGPLSFMEIFDATCESIKGGNNRRGAQIGVLDIWHPDIESFITIKQTKDVLTNFNISVGITDKFMQAVENDDDWDLIFPDTTFEKYNDEWDGNIYSWQEKDYPIIIHKTIKAKELYNNIMKATFKYSEPGILFLDTINRFNNLWWCEYISTTNPCVSGDTLVKTDIGDFKISELIKNGIENYKALSYNVNNECYEYKKITFGDKTRKNTQIIEIELENGSTLKLTPDHKVYTKNRGYINAEQLVEDDELIFK